MDKKTKYEKPMVEIIVIDNNDILLTSGDNNDPEEKDID